MTYKSGSYDIYKKSLIEICISNIVFYSYNFYH